MESVCTPLGGDTTGCCVGLRLPSSGGRHSLGVVKMHDPGQFVTLSVYRLGIV